MEVESTGKGGIMSGIWSISLRDMEEESPGYGGSLRDMYLQSRDME